MKLSDFNIKAPARKKSSLVFNLNNEKRELLSSTKIKSLEDRYKFIENQYKEQNELKNILLKNQYKAKDDYNVIVTPDMKVDNELTKKLRNNN